MCFFTPFGYWVWAGGGGVPSTLRGICTQWATTRGPNAFRAATSHQCVQGIRHPRCQP